MQGRIEELNQKQALAERAVVDFKKQNNMVMADGRLVNEQQIAELNSQLIVAHRQTSEAKARLGEIAEEWRALARRAAEQVGVDPASFEISRN